MQLLKLHLQTLVHCTLLILSVLYSLFCFTRSCMKYFENFQDNYGDFTQGYQYLSTKRDKTDIEWEGIFYLLHSYFPYTLLYLILIELIRYLKLPEQVHQLCQILFMITYFQIQGNIYFFLVLFLQPLFFYSVAFFKQTFLFTWLCSCISLIFITIFKTYVFSLDYLTYDKYQTHFYTVSMYWINLKCTGFYLENVKPDFFSLMSYCFYPPTFFTGPYICYEDYKKVFVGSSKNLTRVRKFIKNLIWCILWYSFGNFCLHFIYVNATSFQPQFVKSLDYVSLCGYGYAMGQFFHIKYLVQYGVSTTIASYENVNVPHLPRCIGRIHLYSDMWRYFDPGLYTFLKRYIYLPMHKILHYKLLASFLCFCFVCVWHGLEDYIVIWAVMNYIGITIEALSSMVYQKKLIHISKFLGPTAMNVIKNIMAAPLLAFSAISNFYFFGGKDVGDIFLTKLFGNLLDSSRLLIVLYCCCQVSTTLRKVHSRKM